MVSKTIDTSLLTNMNSFFLKYFTLIEDSWFWYKSITTEFHKANFSCVKCDSEYLYQQHNAVRYVCLECGAIFGTGADVFNFEYKNLYKAFEDFRNLIKKENE